MIKILFFCTANICRSPVAAGIFTSLVQSSGLDDAFWVESAGTHATAGSAAHPETIRTAARRGLDLSGHRSRALEPADFREFDYLIGMDRANIAAATAIAPHDKLGKLRLLLDGVGGLKTPEVGDPFRQDGGFEEVHQIIELGARKLLEDLKHLYQSKS